MGQMISNVLSAPVIASFSVAAFSLFSPMGLGSIDPVTSTFLGIVFLAALPLAPILLYSRRGHVDFDVSERERRPFFFVLAIASYAIGAAVFRLVDSHVMFVLSMAYVTVTGVVTAISLFWKISVHAAGIAGPVTAMMWVFGPWLGFLHILSLATVIVRYRLKAHSLPQLVAGVIVSIVVTSFVYWILL